ncbi:RlmE family RNA methyltransferase [Candidatus Hepatincolaceae symbiont of Richtersius coronifer]
MKKSHTLNSNLKQKISSKKIRTLSSQLWLKRQINDIYVRAAKQEGYYSRSAYKLIEINNKYNILKPGDKVIDIGAAPGGWSQVASNIIFKKNLQGQLICIDLLAVNPVPHAEIITGDFTEVKVIEQIKAAMKGKANTIISDIAPNTTGSKSLDHLRIMNLVELSFNFAKEVLADHGTLVAKVFQGGTGNTLLAMIKQHFQNVHHFKPPASRKESNEIYLIARGFKGNRFLEDTSLKG